jgi:hypothetical protein
VGKDTNLPSITFEFRLLFSYRGNVLHGQQDMDGREVPALNDWATKSAAKFNTQLDNHKAQAAEFLEKQRLKKVNGTPLWMEVREAVKQGCEDFNRETKRQILFFEVVNNQELRVRADIEGPHRYLLAHFDADRSTIEWECEHQRKGPWGMASTNSGDVVFVKGAPIYEQIIPKEIAEIMLNNLLHLDW